MDWVQHVCPELRVFALGRTQALVRGGAKNVLNLRMSSNEDHGNHVMSAVGTAFDGVAWMSASAQCGLLSVVHAISYGYPDSRGALTDAGKTYLLYLMASCPNLEKVTLMRDMLEHNATRMFLARHATITHIHVRGTDPKYDLLTNYVRDLFRTNDVVLRISLLANNADANVKYYAGRTRGETKRRYTERIAKVVATHDFMRTCVSPASKRMARDMSCIRAYQNLCNTRARLRAIVFALERTGLPLPIGAIILKDAFMGESVGVQDLTADLGKVAAPRDDDDNPSATKRLRCE